MKQLGAGEVFFTDETRTSRGGVTSYHRIWIGPYAEPENTIGIIVNGEDIALPMTTIPHLIRYLEQFLPTEETQT